MPITWFSVPSNILIFVQTSDVSALAEMMFGNVSMKIVGDSVKVHYIRCGGRIDITFGYLTSAFIGPQMSFC